jgi:hypothetical protein
MTGPTITTAEHDKQVKRLAKDVLLMAASGGMPDSYWHTDSRIKRACKVLGWTADQARSWAERSYARRALSS